MKEEATKFWGILELFGHTVLAGEISKCAIGDFIQVNIPKVGIIPKWSKMINPKAIYAITPTTKKAAIQKAESEKAMPIDRWDTEQLFKNRLTQFEMEGKIKTIEVEKNEEKKEIF